VTNTNAGETHYWIAINGASCAMSSFPLPVTVAAKPTPQYMLGFPTLEEARDTQEFMLTAPIPDVRKRLEGFQERVQRGEIIYIQPANPEPPRTGPTMWSNETAIFKGVRIDNGAAAHVAELNKLFAIEGQTRISAISNKPTKTELVRSAVAEEDVPPWEI
jgi:hypothetical protein